MTSAYYLLDGEIRFYHEDNPRTLHYQGNTVKLTPKEAQTLLFAVSKAGEIFRADDVAICLWGETQLNNDYHNKKSQAITHISKIRKRLDQLGYRDQWLQTEESQGYRLVCSVSLHQPATAQPRENKGLRLTARITAGQVLFGALSLLLMVSLLYWVGQEPQVRVTNVKPLPPLSGVSSEPRFSPDGNAIVFSRELGSGQADINIKVESDIHYRRLTHGYFDQAPIFSPSGRLLAFHRMKGEQCMIVVLALDGQYQPIDKAKQVTGCSAATTYSSIAWLSESELLFTDRAAKDQPAQVYRFNLVSAERSEYLMLDDPDYFGAGFYYINYDIASQSLLVLDGVRWIDTNIYHVDGRGHKRLVKTVKDSLRSVGLYQGKIIYKDLDNQLKQFSLDRPANTQVIFANPLFPIDYPAVNASKGKLVFVSGEYYKTSIYRYDLATGEQTPVKVSDKYIQLPLAKKNEILALSRESGVNQVYGYRQVGQEGQYQLSDFLINHKIVAMASSEDERWFAITFPRGTTLYRRSDKGLTEVQHFPLMLWPDFSKSNQRLLMADQSKLLSDKFRLVEYDLSDYQQSGKVEPSGIVVNDALFGVYQDNGIVYTPENSQGVYQFTVGGSKVLNRDVYPITQSAFKYDNGYLYVAIRGRKLLKMSVVTGEYSELPSPLFSSFSVHDNALYYTIKETGDMDILQGVLVER